MLSREAWTLNEGDLVIWTGKQTEHSTLSRRVIYHVIKKEEEQHEGILGGKPWSSTRLTLRPAFDFDFEHPTGVNVGTVSWSTTSELRKLNLIDLGVIRLAFDNFIREFARLHGMEDELAPDPTP